MAPKFLIRVLGWGILLYLTVISAFSLGPLLEAAWFPVLRNLASSVERTGNRVTFTITIDKIRGCRVDHFGYQMEGKIAVAAAVQGSGQVPGTLLTTYRSTIPVTNAAKQLPTQGPASTVYPTGTAFLGPFSAMLPAGSEDATYIRIWADVYYACHPLWLVHQVFGPVEVPPLESSP